MTEEIRRLALVLLADPRTRWNWYKLDRALSARGFAGRCNVAELAASLAKDGLIDSIQEEDPALPNYKITAKGLQFVESVPHYT